VTRKAREMTKERIKQLAIEAGLPRGWYDGPWFKGDTLQTGLSDHMVQFVKLIEADVKKRNKQPSTGS